MGSCLILSALLAAALSQDPLELERERGFGMVRDAEGRPWVGAEVHLLYRPHRDVLDESVADRILTTSDERGRFRVALLPGARYSAWARAPRAGEDGMVRLTKLVNDATGNTPILLAEGEAKYPRRIRLSPDRSWEGHAPLRIRAGTIGRAPNLAEWLETDADGLYTMPVWPGSICLLEVYSGGWLVHRGSSGQTLAWARKQAGESPPLDLLASSWELAVPPRRTRRITLKGDGDIGPIAGAQAFPDRCPIGLEPPVSGADGVLEVVFASDEENPQRLPYSYLLHAEERAEGTLAGTSWRDGEPPETERTLVAGHGVTGRLLLRGEPLEGVTLVLEGSVGTGGGSTWFGVDGRVFRSRADGSFTIPGRCDAYRYRLTAVLTPGLRVRLSALLDGDEGESGKGPLATCVVLASADDPPTEDLGEIELTKLQQVRVTVESTEGTPPGATRVSWTLCTADPDVPHDMVRLSTDRHGRLRILARRREHALLMAQDASGMALKILDAGDRDVTLRLDPRHRVKLQLVDGADRPLAGARAHLVSVRPHERRDSALETTISNMASVHAWAFKTGRTDENGITWIHTPLLDASLDFAIYLDQPGRSPRKLAQIDADRDVDEPIVIRVPEAGG